MLKFHFATAVIFSCVLVACHAQNRPLTLDEYIQAKTDSLQQHEKLPGILVGILDNDTSKYFTTGYADLNIKLPFDPATVFEYGSITKTYTAYVLQRVLKEKNIPDTAFILPYLPDSVQKNQALAKITFISLLNHTSGLPRLPDNMNAKDILKPYDDYTLADLFSFLESVNPKPGKYSNYSNLAVGLAGVLAERLSGSGYSELIEKYITIPFKIHGNSKNNPNKSNKSRGYMRNQPVDFWNMNALAPAGGIKGSAAELLAYLGYLGHPTDTSTNQLIEHLLKETAKFPDGTSIGLSWIIKKQDDKPIYYWHNGGTFGFSTFAAFDREKSKAVVVVVNQFNVNDKSDALGHDIMSRLMNYK